MKRYSPPFIVLNVSRPPQSLRTGFRGRVKRLNTLTPANIVATALFGDGAGACVLRAGDGGLAYVEASGEHTWPDTLDIMGWNVEPDGLGVIFAQAIPPFAYENIGPAISGILARSGRTLNQVDRFVCHPGGKRVVLALEPFPSELSHRSGSAAAVLIPLR